uniref:Sorting nexin 11 n=1 Tax=Otus sunia TaxID=257818 RepID=A0A8C8BKN3_9STRI
MVHSSTPQREPNGPRCLGSTQEINELTTVRVQDPRVQNEGSWNSYVDYKIFLHTNSKAFTAKTSCVRRRYREFVWLRRQLQKNAGLVPVPELPGKSTFFVGSTDEFIEKRRQGLQQFLEKVVQNVVLLSDSRLHLFLQSQLSPDLKQLVPGRGTFTSSKQPLL